ncbi:unnamed protein product [Protopolystoma xenopodis]|uniref:Uncharacterized protein n=1 Tax=Protopolystoma xenopodis TaxID=117903 RepID=A0A3S5BYY2_9PLAT|nr:unnamed protein product [Protopolystoma xenopodis]
MDMPWCFLRVLLSQSFEWLADWSFIMRPMLSCFTPAPSRQTHTAWPGPSEQRDASGCPLDPIPLVTAAP